MKCKILSGAYDLNVDAKIMIGYECGDEKRTIRVGGRRSFMIYIKKDSPLYLIIFSNNIYIVEELRFDEKNAVRLAPYIEKIFSPLQLCSKEEWDDKKRWLTSYYSSDRSVYLCKNGFYITVSSWTDFNEYEGSVTVYLKNGIIDEGRILKSFFIAGGPFIKKWRPEKEIYDYIDHMLECDEISIGEFSTFIEGVKDDYEIGLYHAVSQ